MKEVHAGGTVTTNYYLYADEGLVAEFDGTGAVVRVYGYAPNSLWGNNPLWLRDTGGTSYYLNDHLGAPQKLIDQSGAVVWSATVDPFGATTVDPASTVTNNLRFSSQYFDEESGLHYNTMRYYDPVAGRYVNRDPIGEQGGVNLYRWVHNQPTSGLDAQGLAHGRFILRDVPRIQYDPVQAAGAFAPPENDGFGVRYVPADDCPCGGDEIRLVQAKKVGKRDVPGIDALDDVTERHRRTAGGIPLPGYTQGGGKRGDSKHGPLSYLDAPYTAHSVLYTTVWCHRAD